MNTINEQTNDKFPGIDYTVGVNNVLGDDNLFAEILVMFHQDHGNDSDNIQRAINENNQQQIKHLVHTLKGVSCSIGAMNLFQLCKSLDVVVNEQKSDQYQTLFSPVNVELNKIITGIEQQLADKL